MQALYQQVFLNYSSAQQLARPALGRRGQAGFKHYEMASD